MARQRRLKWLNMTYKEYLESEKWKKVKEYIFSTRENICEICSSKDNLVIHHKTYKYIARYNVKRSSIGTVILCSDCHNEAHILSKSNNYGLKQVIKILKRKYKKEREKNILLFKKHKIMLMELKCKDCGESLNYIVDTNDENTIKDMTQIDITQHIISHYNKHNNEYNNL